MRRFYAHPRQFNQDLVTLDPEETLHLARVLRLGVGARVEVTTARGEILRHRWPPWNPGGPRSASWASWTPGENRLCPWSWGSAWPRGRPLDEVVRQTTEMGVSRIFPFISERSERLTPERVERRRERWQRLARESLKSCQRSRLPLIEPPRDFAAALDGPEEVKLIFWEEERGGGLHSLLQLPRPRDVRVLIGPEGGFSAGEAALAQEAGFHVVSLGPRRLKVPTAALAAITLIQYAWGDLA